jgi:hypothetical protein
MSGEGAPVVIPARFAEDVRADFRAQNRLDFRRIVRIGVVMGWPSQSGPRARPAICGALGRASVNSGAAIQKEPKTMSTPSIEKAPHIESTGPKKRSAKSSAPRRRKVTSAAAAAKMPPKADEPQVERVTKQERLLTLLSQARGRASKR